MLIIEEKGSLGDIKEIISESIKFKNEQLGEKNLLIRFTNEKNYLKQFSHQNKYACL